MHPLDRATWTSGRGRPLRAVVAILATLAGSTVAIAILRSTLDVSFPAPVYLLAVIAVGMLDGTLPAVTVSIGAFLLYDFLFVEPVFTFTISSPDEWLNLLVFLAVAVVVGRLVAVQADRAAEAADRAREAETLHAITDVLAATRTVSEAAPTMLARLAATTAMDRVWLGLGPSTAEETIVSDTGAGLALPLATWQVVMLPSPDAQPRWIRTHLAAPGPRGHGAGATVYRVRVEAAGETLGSLWALRARNAQEPDRTETRILSLAAGQLGQAVARDRLAAEATSAEIARQSDALKTALLDSVSHDLRTPLATIRAAAGSMLDTSVTWSDSDRREAFETIDAEADRMGHLVRNLLDLSRIEGGALKPDLEAIDVGDLVRQVANRLESVARGRIVIDVPEKLPPVLADEVYLSQTVTNLLENGLRYGGDTIRVSARACEPGAPEAERSLELRVEDNGDGVPHSALPRLFQKFYQVPRIGRTARRGMGIGLTVVAGLVRAMGGTVRAEQSRLGGLAIVATLPLAAPPPDEEPGDGTVGTVRSAAAEIEP